MKSIRSFFCPRFPIFGLNTEVYSKNSYAENADQKTPNTDTLYAMHLNETYIVYDIYWQRNKSGEQEGDKCFISSYLFQLKLSFIKILQLQYFEFSKRMDTLKQIPSSVKFSIKTMEIIVH